MEPGAKHTGRTDVPLTEEGERQARRLADALSGRTFALVLSSPLARALGDARAWPGSSPSCATS